MSAVIDVQLSMKAMWAIHYSSSIKILCSKNAITPHSIAVHISAPDNINTNSIRRMPFLSCVRALTHTFNTLSAYPSYSFICFLNHTAYQWLIQLACGTKSFSQLFFSFSFCNHASGGSLSCQIISVPYSGCP